MLIKREKCPLCESDKSSVVFQSKYSEKKIRSYIIDFYNLENRNLTQQYDEFVGDEIYKVNSCDKCSLTYQSCYPDAAFSGVIYGEWVKRENVSTDFAVGTNFTEVKHWMSEALKLTSMAMRLTGKDKPGQVRVLDFGMGQGVFASALKACGCDTYGYDFAEDRQEHGNSLGVKMVGLSDIKGMEFDFINTEQVFEHLPEPLETARILSGALAKNGLLKISVPFNKWLEKGDFEIDWDADRYGKHSPIPNAPLEHLQYYRRPSLDILAKSMNLKRVKINTLEHLQLSMDWFKPAVTAKNLGRIVSLDKFRNYYIFQKQ